LLKNKIDGTPVVPVFVAESSDDGNKYQPFNRGIKFPAAEHVVEQTWLTSSSMSTNYRFVLTLLIFLI
jgi:hypothetical protein